MQSPIVYLDPWGDLKIVAADRDKRLKTLVVSSSVMRLASPVWRVMFDPHGSFREAEESAKEIEFPDDDADALLILLRIVHLGWRLVPESISSENLADLAVLCDKYDMIRFVRPWLARWQSRPLAIMSAHEDRLFIAWTFGDYASFVTNTKRLVLSCNTDDAGRLTRGEKVIELDFAPGLVDNILRARKAILTATVEACSRFTNCYGPGPVHLPHTASSVIPKQSDTLVFWSLKLGLPAIRVWPGPVNADDIHMGIDDMVMQLPDRSCCAKKDRASGRSDHSGCGYGGGADLTREVVGIYDRFLPAVFEESYRKHMEEQARK